MSAKVLIEEPPIWSIEWKKVLYRILNKIMSLRILIGKYFGSKFEWKPSYLKRWIINILSQTSVANCFSLRLKSKDSISEYQWKVYYSNWKMSYLECKRTEKKRVSSKFCINNTRPETVNESGDCWLDWIEW